MHPPLEANFHRGGDVNWVSLSNSTAIHRAAVGGHLETIIWLAQQGTPISSETKRNQTALHLAARSGRFELVKWLVDVGGLSVSLRDSKRHTAEDLARIKGYPEIQEWLKNKEDL
eukprot:TRINITY_DN483_c0_g1_i11.p3 TRINITY_DN483_c0_g1~~TRINITY_DN483_c0_g1_i11.p3  ORF type:complete len:115 (-),score=26.37 TRINITY_DN483_c0_g1_i11:246-590(-)